MSPLVVIVACHFLSAFAILGMSPYYETILERSFHVKDPFWAGLVYVTPLFVMTVAGPLWGAFGDRFGKKLSVMRAQIGLAVALFLCGQTHSPWTFAACLVVQGIFGGTFSASNALLAEYYRGPLLAKALSSLQYSARLGLFLAPSVLGVLLMAVSNPLRAYLWLWILPLASFIVLNLFLDKPPPALDEVTPADVDLPPLPLPRGPSLSFRFLLVVELWFTLITVMTFPYFVKYFTALPTGVDEKLSGVYFGTPHVVYLLLAFLVIRRATVHRALELVAFAFGLFTLSMVGHLLVASAAWLLLARVLLGVSFVFGFIYINELVGHGIKQASAGRAFGWLDTASKFGGVLAGLGASAAVHFFGLAGPFEVAGVLGGLCTLLLGWLSYRGIPARFANS